MTITITCPLPHKACHPNARPHWQTKATAMKGDRAAGKLCAMDIMNILYWSYRPWKSATVQATFVHRTRRTRDPLNAYASLKGLIDGVVDAGLLADDDQLQPLPAVFEVGPDPRVILVFEKVE